MGLQACVDRRPPQLPAPTLLPPFKAQCFSPKTPWAFCLSLGKDLSGLKQILEVGIPLIEAK
ncbi:hypothetical protein MCQ_00522 [Candidatus Bartonella washoeensis Sb944nv]|uniref:Uncharacterized protein n=2 Tax=Candidatus Bartonella washoeensis TaxID=186739 RepID=J0Z7Q9_9HYPH|nr:hypothetical protein [Bartonella washoeensis]EJF80018.1 hypothetical protein MCQ_00522 [Bartonella washoeensis Sb944nv]EJF83748.1 hypothetical protein MCW_01297 [Bartonella washoeensis 085-0475]